MKKNLTLASNSSRNLFSKYTKNYGIVVAIILLGLIFSLSSEYFFTFDNLSNILLQSSTIAIVAVGQAFVLLVGEFDLSVGQTVCVTGCLTAYLMRFAGFNPWIAILIGTALGIFIGISNGVMVAYLRIPAFVATLGWQNIARGLSKIITNATPIPNLPEDISFFGRGYALGLPISVLIMIGIYIIATFVSRKTKLGRYFYAIGGGSEAAFFAGINIKKYRCIAFAISGFLAAVSGLILISRLNSAAITNGNAYEFDAIIACIIGGISLSGGKGKIIQALFGAIFLIMFFNGMTMLNVDPFYQDVLKGIVLIISVGVDVIRNKKRV